MSRGKLVGPIKPGICSVALGMMTVGCGVDIAKGTLVIIIGVGGTARGWGAGVLVNEPGAAVMAFALEPADVTITVGSDAAAFSGVISRHATSQPTTKKRPINLFNFMVSQAVFYLARAALPIFLWGQVREVAIGINEIQNEAIKLGGLLQHGEVVAIIQANVVTILCRLA